MEGSKFLAMCAAVGVAGFFGAIARYLVAIGCNAAFGRGFPVGTLLINLSGSFALGWFAVYAGGRAGMSDVMKVAVGTGFLGAYTTFSTWALESNALLEEGFFWRAAANLVGSLVLGLVAVRLGVAMGR